MSWLEAPRDRTVTPANASADPHRTFLRHRVAVERDLDTGDLVRHHDPSGVWIHAFPSREALAGSYDLPADEVDATEKTGAQLRTWVRQHCPEAGVVFRQGIDEQVVVWPATTVQRVVLE